MIEIYLSNSEAYEHAQNSKSNKTFRSSVKVFCPQSTPNQDFILPHKYHQPNSSSEFTYV